jgi:hypothetical protein
MRESEKAWAMAILESDRARKAMEDALLGLRLAQLEYERAKTGHEVANARELVAFRVVDAEIDAMKAAESARKAGVA